jgi:hypothetical protein
VQTLPAAEKIENSNHHDDNPISALLNGGKMTMSIQNPAQPPIASRMSLAKRNTLFWDVSMSIDIFLLHVLQQSRPPKGTRPLHKCRLTIAAAVT